MTRGRRGGSLAAMNRITSPLTKLIAFVAALAVLGGGTAVAAKMITGKQIKNGTVTGKDLKPGSLGAKHLSPAAAAGLAGPAGEPGPKGDTGPKGERGPSTAFAIRTKNGLKVDDPAVNVVQTATVPDGSYVINAKATVLNAAKDTTLDCELGVLRGIDFEQLDQVSGIELDVSGTPHDAAAVSMLAVATVDNGTNKIQMRCTPEVNDALFVRDRTIVATQVAELK